MPTQIDPPFAVPIECVMDLPFPPSTNRIWRADAKLKANGKHKMGVYRSSDYVQWIKRANICAVANGTWRHRRVMPNAFRALILLDRALANGGDVDNRIKAVLDWAQRSELIRNDKLCMEVTARWVTAPEAPHGCRLILRSVA